MATKILKNGKYGVTELRLPQNIEVKVQDITWGDLKSLENGMFVKVDTRTGKMEKGVATTDDVYFVHSVPKLYERHLSSSDYVMTPDGFLPRLIRFGKGSIIATDNIIVDESEFATYDAIATALKSAPVYGYLDDTTQLMKVSKSKSTEVVLFEITKVTTLKTGELGVEAVRI